VAEDTAPGRVAERASLESRYYGDEVSLRELYLVFRAGLPLIIAAALVVGALAFALQALRTPQYTATATVNVIPPLVGTDSLSGLELSVTAGMDSDSYRAIAESLDLLGEVASGFTIDGSQLTAIDLAAVTQLSSRQAASQARGHLVVEHAVTLAGDEGKDKADEVANAWAEATVAEVANTLSSHLAGAVETVNAEIAERRAAFQAASDAWAEFLAKDERAALTQQLALAAAQEGASAAGASDLRERLARLEAEAATLERELSTASLVYYRVAPTGPALELQRDLVAGSVFVAIAASTPVRPQGPSKVVVAVAAALVAGLAATLLVFLRAAVRER